MLLGLNLPLGDGQSFPLTLNFAKDGARRGYGNGGKVRYRRSHVGTSELK